MKRTFSPDEVRLGTDQILDEIKHRFDPEEWLSDHRNIALVNDARDIGLFEAHGSPGVYHGHYFFQSRGKDAIAAAKAFLTEGFDNYGIDRVMGFTPTKKKGAMWLTRHLGFVPLSIETINGEDFQVWTMHKKECMNV
jgi:hypothetical protein